MEKVGSRAIKRMEWMIAFANVEWDDINEQEKDQWSTELQAFAFLSGLDWAPGQHVSTAQMQTVAVAMFRRVHEGKEPERASQDEVIEAQRTMRNLLSHVVVPRANDVKMHMPVTVLIETDRDSRTGRVRTFHVRQTATHFMDQIRLGVARLLAQFAAAVIVCRECRQYGLARRVDQVFCSRTCLSRATTRRHRKKQDGRINTEKRQQSQPMSRRKGNK